MMIMNDNLYHITALIKQKTNQWPPISDADEGKRLPFGWQYHLYINSLYETNIQSNSRKGGQTT